MLWQNFIHNKNAAKIPIHGCLVVSALVGGLIV